MSPFRSALPIATIVLFAVGCSSSCEGVDRGVPVSLASGDGTPLDKEEATPADAPTTLGPQRGKNLVIVLSDALRAASLPIHGYPRSTTPHLDALAEQSVVFARHFAAAPYTRLSVSQMLSGTLFPPIVMASQRAFGVEPEPFALTDDLLLLPRALGERGYARYLVSAHPWFNPEARVWRHFDRRAVPTSSRGYARFAELMGEIEATLDHAVAEGAPFFLYVHSMDTHAPNRLHPNFQDHVGDGRADPRYDEYDSEIAYTDHHLGLLLRALRARDLLEHTIVVFTSDHGEEFNERGPESYHRTHGANVGRAATHIPLLIRFPNRFGAGRRLEGLTSHLDLAPTLLSLLAPDVDLSALVYDGRNLGPALASGRWEEISAEPVYSESTRFFAARFPSRVGVDAIYDKWSGRSALLEYVQDRSNYPRPRQLRAPGDEELDRVRDHNRDRRRRFARLPRLTLDVERRDLKMTGHVVLDDTDHPVVYRLANDDRWSMIHSGRYLASLPGESPGAITLRAPVAMGRYRLSLLIGNTSHNAFRELRNGVTVRIEGGAPASRRIEPDDARRVRWIEVGEVSSTDELRITFEAPVGGVAISKMRLTPISTERGAEGTAEDASRAEPELTDQLRALGYVE